MQDSGVGWCCCLHVLMPENLRLKPIAVGEARTSESFPRALRWLSSTSPPGFRNTVPNWIQKHRDPRGLWLNFSTAFMAGLFWWAVWGRFFRAGFASNSVGLEMHRLRIIWPERVGSTTSIERMSDRSARTQRSSLPRPARIQSCPIDFHRTYVIKHTKI